MAARQFSNLREKRSREKVSAFFAKTSSSDNLMLLLTLLVYDPCRKKPLSQVKCSQKLVLIKPNRELECSGDFSLKESLVQKRGEAKGKRYKVQGTRYKVQGTRYKAQGTRHKAQGTRHKAQSARHKAQSTRYKIQGTRYKEQGTRYKAQGTRYTRESYRSADYRKRLRTDTTPRIPGERFLRKDNHPGLREVEANAKASRVPNHTKITNLTVGPTFDSGP